MIANQKAVAGAGTPTAAGVDEFDRLNMSKSILPQNEEDAQRVVTMIAKVLCRLYGEATNQQLVVTSVKRRQDMTTK